VIYLVRKIGPVKIGKDTIIGEDVTLGYPGKKKINCLKEEEHCDLPSTIIGESSIIRDLTIIYSGTELGKRVKTGHHVLIREGCSIGDGCTIGSGTIVEDNCDIGEGVSLQSGVFLSTGTIIKDHVFIGPEVCITNDKKMDSNIKPVVVEEGVKVGANSTILAGVVLEKGSMVGAGSVVCEDVPENTLVCGNPARKKVIEY